MSALAIWLGGVTFLGTAASYLENAQPILIAIGVILSLFTCYQIWKIRKAKKPPM